MKQIQLFTLKLMFYNQQSINRCNFSLIRAYKQLLQAIDKGCLNELDGVTINVELGPSNVPDKSQSQTKFFEFNHETKVS
jgi:hypothetical protein